MKPKLLILQLWQLGDLMIAMPFIRAASEQFDVTLVAKPYALELRPRFWPDARGGGRARGWDRRDAAP